MGINKQILKLLLAEEDYKPINGEFLCIGKQTVNVSQSDLENLFINRAGYSYLKNLYDNNIFDISTRHSNNTIYDHDLLKCISDSAHYNCLDRSDYEGANIIQDMNEIIKDDYVGKFDFIYDGGCLDNVFDPVTFLINSNKMLKPGGRIAHLNVAGSTLGAYLMLSPEWFFSYYAVNNYTDCKVYVAIANEEGPSRHIFDTHLYEWQPFFTRKNGFNYSMIDASKTIDGIMFCLVIAEKGDNSSCDKRPIQMQYLDEQSVDWRQKYYEFSATNRPKLSAILKNTYMQPYSSDHYKYLGSNF